MVISYKEHKNKWKDCNKCELHKGRTKIVLAKGKIPSQIVLVGEAPGFSEDVQGIPFIGPAGNLLNEIVNKSIPESIRVSYTNLLACIPRDEEEPHLKVTAPPKDCIKACSKRLLEFINLARPKLVICVGEEATSYFNKHTEQRPECIKKIISITHPSAILRKPVAHQVIAKREAIVTITQEVRKMFNC